VVQRSHEDGGNDCPLPSTALRRPQTDLTRCDRNSLGLRTSSSSGTSGEVDRCRWDLFLPNSQLGSGGRLHGRRHVALVLLVQSSASPAGDAIRLRSYASADCRFVHAHGRRRECCRCEPKRPEILVREDACPTRRPLSLSWATMIRHFPAELPCGDRSAGSCAGAGLARFVGDLTPGPNRQGHPMVLAGISHITLPKP
jgi:hypothetical protein